MRVSTRSFGLFALSAVIGLAGLGVAWAVPELPAAEAPAAPIAVEQGSAAVEEPAIGAEAPTPQLTGNCNFIWSYQPSAQACKEWCYLEQECGMQSYDPGSDRCQCGYKL